MVKFSPVGLAKSVLKHAVASPGARAGILTASATFASSFSRGLLPRSVSDQAIATGACAVIAYEMGTTVHSAAQTLALVSTGSRGMRGRTAHSAPTLAIDLAFVGIGSLVEKALPEREDELAGRSAVRTAGTVLKLGGSAGATLSLIDATLKTVFRTDKVASRRSVLIDVAVGGSVAAFGLWNRLKRAEKYGLVDPERRAVKQAGLVPTVKAAGLGAAAASGLLVLVGFEDAIAQGVQWFLNEKVTFVDIGSPLLGHAVSMTVLGAAGVWGHQSIKHRIERSDNVIEPAYFSPPTNPNVTAGPRSVFAFDDIGKEGRRFVLMTLTPEEITAVMNEPAQEPVRIVAGYETTKDTNALAEMAFEEMQRLGAFDKSVICIASPTGVGYVNYIFGEALEYLTRGDSAIVVPQYALVPSMLALFDTNDGIALHTRIIELARDHIAAMPEGQRPKLVQFGESLGAQVAMDVCGSAGVPGYDQLGLDAGLYLGVPFRTQAWLRWMDDRDELDPNQELMLVTAAPELVEARSEGDHVRKHVMIVHNDDPVNKFSYRMVIKRPWWLGAPTSRPPMVPRETVWRPFFSFVICLVDLANGMHSQPGLFVRRGHDYRIDICEATSVTYDLPCSLEQETAIEAALRQREQDWATKRLVARKFMGAKNSITNTLGRWGVQVPDLDTLSLHDLEVADIDPSSSEDPPSGGTLDAFTSGVG